MAGHRLQRWVERTFGIPSFIAHLNLTENWRNSLRNAVASFTGVPLAPFSPAAKIAGREEWGESREGKKHAGI